MQHKVPLILYLHHWRKSEKEALLMTYLCVRQGFFGCQLPMDAVAHTSACSATFFPQICCYYGTYVVFCPKLCQQVLPQSLYFIKCSNSEVSWSSRMFVSTFFIWWRRFWWIWCFSDHLPFGWLKMRKWKKIVWKKLCHTLRLVSTCRA